MQNKPAGPMGGVRYGDGEAYISEIAVRWEGRRSENFKFSIPSLCLCGIHKLAVRKAPAMPGHKSCAEME